MGKEDRWLHFCSFDSTWFFFFKEQILNPNVENPRGKKIPERTVLMLSQQVKDNPVIRAPYTTNRLDEQGCGEQLPVPGRCWASGTCSATAPWWHFSSQADFQNVSIICCLPGVMCEQVFILREQSYAESPKMGWSGFANQSTTGRLNQHQVTVGKGPEQCNSGVCCGAALKWKCTADKLKITNKTR